MVIVVDGKPQSAPASGLGNGATRTRFWKVTLGACALSPIVIILVGRELGLGYWAVLAVECLSGSAVGWQGGRARRWGLTVLGLLALAASVTVGIFLPDPRSALGMLRGPAVLGIVLEMTAFIFAPPLFSGVIAHCLGRSFRAPERV